MDNLIKANWLTAIFNLLGTAAFVFLLYTIFQNNELPGVEVCLILPVIAILIITFSKGWIKLFREDNVEIPSIGIPFVVPLIGLTILVLREYDLIIDYFWFVFLTLFFSVFLLFYLSFFNAIYVFRKPINIKSILISVITIVIYCGVNLLVINGHYDNSEPEILLAELIKKTKEVEYRNRERKVDFYVEVISNHEVITTEKILVSKKTWDSVNNGDCVSFYKKSGLLGIAWYYLKVD